MRRTIWSAVLMTSLVLIGAGAVSSWTWPDALAFAARVGRACAPLWSGMLSAVQELASLRAVRMPSTWTWPDPEFATIVAAAVVLALALLALIMRWARRPADRRRVVLRLARSGAATARIARRSGLAQDAVRVLLRPEGLLLVRRRLGRAS